MRKTTTTLGLSALVASLLVGATPTEARERNGWATIPFRATSTGGAQEELAAECAPDGASCIGSYRLTSPTFGGDLDGASIGAEIATISPSGTVSVRITSIFTGSVRGCGYGTVVYTNDGTFNSSTATSFRFALTIVPGTGTGDLQGLTGAAIGTTDLTDPSGTSTVVGALRCKRQP